MPLRPRGIGLTDVGKVREHNEDSYLMDEGLGIFVVADGMGGRAGGEIASAEAVEQVYSMVKRQSAVLQAMATDPSEDNRAIIRRAVESAVQAATYMVFSIAEQDPARKGMGTTVSTLVVAGGRAFVGQVGDSRVYMVRNGLPVQITEDHTLVNMQLKAGAITVEQAKHVPYSHMITRAVGVKDYVEVDTFEIECLPGDRFILCSDGVHGYMEEPEQLLPLATRPTKEETAQVMLQYALDGGGRDNATLIVVEMVEA